MGLGVLFFNVEKSELALTIEAVQERMYFTFCETFSNVSLKKKTVIEVALCYQQCLQTTQTFKFIV
jgi:hypothetical protein